MRTMFKYKWSSNLPGYLRLGGFSMLRQPFSIVCIRPYITAPYMALFE